MLAHRSPDLSIADRTQEDIQQTVRCEPCATLNASSCQLIGKVGWCAHDASVALGFEHIRVDKRMFCNERAKLVNYRSS